MASPPPRLKFVISAMFCCVRVLDSIGVRLLSERGIDFAVIISMLNKVKLSPGMPSLCREGIDVRIKLLTQQSDSTH